MGIETDLNVNPYYDDFDENKDFHNRNFKDNFSKQIKSKLSYLCKNDTKTNDFQ